MKLAKTHTGLNGYSKHESEDGLVALHQRDTIKGNPMNDIGLGCCSVLHIDGRLKPLTGICLHPTNNGYETVHDALKRMIPDGGSLVMPLGVA